MNELRDGGPSNLEDLKAALPSQCVCVSSTLHLVRMDSRYLQPLDERRYLWRGWWGQTFVNCALSLVQGPSRRTERLEAKLTTAVSFSAESMDCPIQTSINVYTAIAVRPLS